MKSPWPLLCAAVLVSACAVTPERVSDPFAEIDASRTLGQAAYPSLSLAVALTPNAKNALAYADAAQSAATTSRVIDLRKPLDSLLTQLRANFKVMTKAPSVEEARATGADVVAVVDFYEKLGPMSFQLEENVLFLAPSGETLDKLSASSKKGALDTPSRGLSNDYPSQMVVMAEDEARDAFQAALAGSEGLQRILKLRAGALAGPQPKGGRSDVDEPRYKTDEDANKYALVFGVENYESLPSADYAERDARAVRDHLYALGYPRRNVIYLTGQQAGKAGIEKYVESWLPRNVDESSQVFVYFSGHGAPDVASGQAFLMPWDADAKFVDATGYPVGRLYKNLAALKAKRIVVALDSCFSGAGGRSVIAKGARPLITKVNTGLPDSPKLVVLAAASGDEITGAAEGQAHGLFTYYLLKGLNERGGAASVKTLYDFLKPKVEDAARRDNRDQTPQLLPSASAAAERL